MLVPVYLLPVLSSFFSLFTLRRPSLPIAPPPPLPSTAFPLFVASIPRPSDCEREGRKRREESSRGADDRDRRMPRPTGQRRKSTSASVLLPRLRSTIASSSVGHGADSLIATDEDEDVFLRWWSSVCLFTFHYVTFAPPLLSSAAAALD